MAVILLLSPPAAPPGGGGRILTASTVNPGINALIAAVDVPGGSCASRNVGFASAGSALPPSALLTPAGTDSSSSSSEAPKPRGVARGGGESSKPRRAPLSAPTPLPLRRALLPLLLLKEASKPLFLGGPGTGPRLPGPLIAPRIGGGGGPPNLRPPRSL
jgi:hypothetical protein